MTAATTVEVRTPSVWRRRLVLLLLVAAACVVLGRAFYLQVLDNAFLSQQGDMRFIRTLTLPGFRGAIVDRRGRPLALSAPVDSIWAVPADVLAAPQYLPALAQLLNRRPAQLREYLQKRHQRKFVYLERQMAPAAARRIMALKAPGIFSQREYRRYYPAGAVVAQVVGFTNIDGKGQAGIERADNAVLRGVDGSRRVVRSRSGQIIEDTNVYKPAQPGKNIHLTLDLRLQYIAYRDLKQAVAAHHGESGTIAVADARSGQILALASVPSFNPNDPADRTSQGVRDRAVADTFEPGSSVKPLLVSQAMTLGKFNMHSRINTGNGTLRVASMTIHDDDKLGIINLQKLLEKSSNVGAATIGLTLGAEAVRDGYRKFGLGERTGIGLPNEAYPTLRPWNAWGEIATATASYGYGIAFNALQMLRAYCALADNGLMPSLSIVQGNHPLPPQRVIPARIAKEVRGMLEAVVSPDGTAVGAAVPGYQVAGKTGTSRMVVNGHYARGKYHAIFVGMLPAGHPRLVGIVVINAPKGYNYFGGSVSGPVFSKVMQAAARLLQIAPDRPAPGLLPAADVNGGGTA